MLLVLGASLKVQSRANLFSHLIRLPASYFEKRHLGDVMSRFGSQETIQQTITTELVLEAVIDGLMALRHAGPDVRPRARRWPRSSLAGAVLYAGLRWATYTPLRDASAEAIVGGARRDSHFLETLRGIQTIKLFNAQDDRAAQLAQPPGRDGQLGSSTTRASCSCCSARANALLYRRCVGFSWCGSARGWCLRQAASRSACCSRSSPTRTSSCSASAR